MIERCFSPPGSVHGDLITPPIGMKHQSDNIVYTSPGNCSPASNSSANFIIASCSEWTRCHSSGYITPFPSVRNHSNLVSQQIKSWRSSSDLGQKMFTHLKAYLMQRDCISYILMHPYTHGYIDMYVCKIKNAGLSSQYSNLTVNKVYRPILTT